MPSIRGNVFYSKDSYGGTIYDKFMNVSEITIWGASGFVPVTIPKPAVVSDVPIVLAQLDSAGNIYRGLCIKTGSDGSFQFTSVEQGSYLLAEAYGTEPKAAATGNFAMLAAAMAKVIPKDPEISFMTAHSLTLNGASRIVSLTPNSLFINVGTTDIEKLYFLDAPVKDVPLSLNDYVLSGENLVKNGDQGSWGILPAGSKVNTSPLEPAPYSDESTLPSSSLSEFTYIQYAKNGSTSEPDGGSYTITNINKNMNFNGVWFDMPDHTTGDETGRMMIVNGALSSTGGNLCFYKETIIGLKSYTKYLFATWICNIYRLHGSSEPNLAVTVTDNLGNILYDKQSIGSLGVQTIPTWYQLGQVIDTGAATGVNIRFVSMGPEAVGNDYVIDDIIFQRLSAAPEPAVKKSVEESTVLQTEPIHYKVEVYNPGPVALINSVLYDEQPEGTEVVDDEVKLTRDGTTTVLSGTALTQGIQLGQAAVGETIIIAYSIRITHIEAIPIDNIIRNKSALIFSFILKEEQGALTGKILSNEVETKVIIPKVNFKKGSCADTVIPDSYARYELLAVNTSNTVLRWLEIWDEMGLLAEYVSFSTQAVIEKRKLQTYELQAEPEDIGSLQEGVYVIYTSTQTKHTYKVIVKTDIEEDQLVAVKYMVHIKDEAKKAEKIDNAASIGYKYDLGEEILHAPEDETDEMKKDETVLKVAYAKINVEKGAYKITESGEIPVAHMGEVVCNEHIIYKITLTNTGNKKASNVEIIDCIPEQIRPDYCMNLSCKGITQKVISPVQGEELPIGCEDIVRLDKNIVNCITIKNIEVPARTAEDEPGRVEVRIYGKVLCR